MQADNQRKMRRSEEPIDNKVLCRPRVARSVQSSRIRWLLSLLLGITRSRYVVRMCSRVCVDIDECQGSVGTTCGGHGVCDGFSPPGSFTCVCDAGYELNSAKDACVGQFLYYHNNNINNNYYQLDFVDLSGYFFSLFSVFVMVLLCSWRFHYFLVSCL